jgi:predicted kinase
MKLYKYDTTRGRRGEIFVIMAKDKEEANKKLQVKLGNKYMFKLVKEIEGDIFETGEIFYD